MGYKTKRVSKQKKTGTKQVPNGNGGYTTVDVFETVWETETVWESDTSSSYDYGSSSSDY